MKKSKWPRDRESLLEALADGGYSRREIAQRLNANIYAVTVKLHHLGRLVPLEVERAEGEVLPAPVVRAAPPAFPRFEDITRSEARAIATDAPNSAPFARGPDFSVTGSAAWLCVSS